MEKICIITTVWSSINNWIKPFLDEYYKNKIDVTIICNMDEEYEMQLQKEYPFIHTKAIPFPRGISFGGSVKSIFALKRFLQKEKFDLVQYSTPNASFYASLVSKICKVPVRLYCQWGMVYVTQTGFKRKVFKLMEKMICKNSTMIQPDSFGNLEFCRKEKLYDETKSCVIWNGSAKGLDLSIFDVNKKENYATEIKNKYGLKNETIIGFVGRLGKEKGCNELFKAFKIIKQDYPTAKLLFVGPIEKENTIEPKLLKYFNECDDIIKTGRVNNVEKYMSAMDVFVLPSYREGFGMSVIEASAMEVPVVVTKYPGPSGGMVDNVTGISIDIGSTDQIVNAVKRILDNKELAINFGKNGRKFVKEKFDYILFKEKYMENRKKLLYSK